MAEFVSVPVVVVGIIVGMSAILVMKFHREAARHFLNSHDLRAGQHMTMIQRLIYHFKILGALCHPGYGYIFRTFRLDF